MTKFSNSFHLLPINPIELLGGSNIFNLEDGYYRLEANKHILFGKKGKALFNKNENSFIPYNYFVFKELVQGLSLPTIMNFYDTEFHLKEKRKFEYLLNSNTVIQLFKSIEEDTNKLFLDIRNSTKEACLFDEIAKYIIKVQSKYFFNYRPSLNELEGLVYFEDYFTLGLYINPASKLKNYFNFRDFAESKNIFNEIYNKIKSKSFLNASINYKFNLEYEFISEENIHNQFYNFITAGSANIAKCFIYLLCFIKENNYNEFVIKKDNSNNEIYSFAGKFLNEFYRLIPFVENQVVGPYIYRICHEDFTINEIYNIKKGDEVFYYNSISNIDPSIHKTPLIFNPFRENLEQKGKSSTTYGAGVHRCSGAFLADLWFHHLLVGYLKSGINLKSEKGIQHITYNPDFEEVKKIKYMIKPYYNEKY
jgi:cytochrome P450